MNWEILILIVPCAMTTCALILLWSASPVKEDAPVNCARCGIFLIPGKEKNLCPWCNQKEGR